VLCSAECVEGKTCELLGVDGVLRSSAVRPCGRDPERTSPQPRKRVVGGGGGSVDRRQRGPAAPPPGVTADPEPGMIAKTRGPLSVKDHSFAVRAHRLPGITIESREKPGAPYSPLLEQPGFSLASIRPTETQKGYSANFAFKSLPLKAFSEVRYPQATPKPRQRWFV
jgi:hypothetical protein